MSTSFQILIIEDTPEKCQLVKEKLMRSTLGLAIEISVAVNLITALNLLARQYYDLVLLDVRIPTSAANPSSANSRIIIEQLASGALIMPACVIGLTAFDEEFEKEAKYYSENLFSIERYSTSDDNWLHNVVSRIKFILRWKSSYGRSRCYDYDFDLVIVTTRYENEFCPILESIDWNSGPEDDLLLYKDSKLKTGTIRLGAFVVKVCIFCTEEMGLPAAAAITSQLIAQFRPRIIAMLGMCCGFQQEECQNKSKLGDVIVVHSVACWDEGRYGELDDKSFFFNRAKPAMVDQKADKVIASMIESEKHTLNAAIKPVWDTKAKTIRKKFRADTRSFPDLKYGLLLSGSSVVAHDVKGDEIIGRFPNALGVDMEMFAVFKSASRASGATPLVIGAKGVADFGDGDKHKEFQAVASQLSYGVGMAIVQRCIEKGAVEIQRS